LIDFGRVIAIVLLVLLAVFKSGQTVLLLTKIARYLNNQKLNLYPITVREILAYAPWIAKFYTAESISGRLHIKFSNTGSLS